MSDDAWSGEREVAASPWREVIGGILLVLAEHALAAGLLGGGALLIETVNGSTTGGEYMPFFMWGFGIGLAQLGYVLPTFAVTFLWRRRVAAGVALGALITFLLNGACFGALCATMGTM